MLKMIIADDEYNVREGLRDVVPWEEMGIAVVAVASDGPETLELCQSLRPDILITDIRMPVLDGLEAANRLRELDASVRIIIISGAQDFNYAKTAVNLNVDGYILKPIKVNELQDTVRKVADSIRAERSREAYTHQLRQQLTENMPALREQFLANLTMGMYRDERELADKLVFFGLPLQRVSSMRAALFQIDDYEQAVERYSEENKQLIRFSVNNIMEEIVGRSEAGIAFCLNENRFVVLFDQSGREAGFYLNVVQEIIDSVSAYLKLSLSAGIGNPVQRLGDLHRSYYEAESAIGYKFFTGKSSILHGSDFNEGRVNVDLARIYEDQNKLIYFMKLGRREEVAHKIRSIFEAVCKDRSSPIGYVQSVGVEQINMASRAFHEVGESIEAVLPDFPSLIGDLYAHHDAAELVETMQKLFDAITAFFWQKNNQKNSGTIKKIKDIISKKYMENITVSRLSEEVYLSPNYISLIFKQETGETITEYVTKIRMEAAKELLRAQDLKVLEVAEMIGYDNAAYFSTVFKKYTGMHPQKYRSLFYAE
ncbi:response regulator [Cohnella cellulosilytica]|uniref:Response regulator n=1 Tax=Cohnella cellulosilytica TaxID=986710 RepID=A0ABW2F3P5_9BACL